VEELGRAVHRNARQLVDRRILLPIQSIVADLVLNQRMAIADHEALKDAQRSLGVMLKDTLEQVRFKPRLSPQEQIEVVRSMNMTPFSKQFELEIRRPVPSLVSGNLLRLLLLQLQFVKREMLLAISAIDELYATNQVNMQLFAIIPALICVRLLKSTLSAVWNLFRSPYRLRTRSSRAAVEAEIRNTIRGLSRQIERRTLMEAESLPRATTTPPSHTEEGHINSEYYIDMDSESIQQSNRRKQFENHSKKEFNSRYVYSKLHPSGGISSTSSASDSNSDSNKDNFSNSRQRFIHGSASASGSGSGMGYSSSNKSEHESASRGGHRNVRRRLRRRRDNSYSYSIGDGSSSLESEAEEYGRLLSTLYRLQQLLLIHTTKFDGETLKQLQEELRDLAEYRLGSQQRLIIMDRIVRSHAFLQNPKKSLW